MGGDGGSRGEGGRVLKAKGSEDGTIGSAQMTIRIHFTHGQTPP